METTCRELVYAKDVGGREPAREWVASIRDKKTQGIILSRIYRLKFGDLGDCESIGGGVWEIRIHVGPGYRLYFGQKIAILVLLGGGTKKSQSKDIARAKRLLAFYIREQREPNRAVPKPPRGGPRVHC
ncbi:MAG: type II toxin-antitoxin system RelE/ParE family toxin [Candidatus Lambdaproteobacteria bacterium]|nr:type II toxin-antitoxin system RelE/ParE family toxin [Candidatus Lambdaproteobacteria bacterium]